MPIDDAERARLQEATRQAFTKYVNAGVDTYVRQDLGGALGFEVLRPSIAEIIEAAERVLTLPLDSLPPRLLQALLDAAASVEAQLDAMKAFDVVTVSQGGQNPVQYRQNLITNFDNAEPVFWDRLAPVYGFLGTQSALQDPERSGSAARAVISQATYALAEVSKAQEELAGIVQASRDAAADVGVSRHASHFATEGDIHARAAKAWLGATGFFAAVTLVAVVANLGHALAHSSDSGFTVQLVLAKVLAFSLLISATVWCGSSYRAHRHNAVVNRHRQNALGSFQAFVSASSDDQTKNAVLLHAAQSIFAPQPSGYMSGEAEPAGPSQLIEIVRSVTQPSK